MSWVQGIVQFFNYLAWTLYVIGLIVACFECGINYAGGKGDIRAVALNAIKGFMAASLFSVVPVRLYQLAISLQAEFTSGMTGYGTSIGEVAANIVQEYEEIETRRPCFETHLRLWGRNKPHHGNRLHHHDGVCRNKGVLRKPQTRWHIAHPDRSRQPVYVQYPARRYRRICPVDEAGHRCVPHSIPTGDDTHCRTTRVQGARTARHWAYALVE